MAEYGRHHNITTGDGNGNNKLSSTEAGIPSGLNRIKTTRKSTDRLLNFMNNNHNNNEGGSPRSSGIGFFRPPPPPPPPVAVAKHKTGQYGNKEGHHKGKNFARWFTSYLSKGYYQVPNNNISVKTEVGESEIKMLNKEGADVAKHPAGKESSTEQLGTRKIPIGLKSFSHELGPKGGIRPVHPRAHSYNDLKELLGSLHSRFDAAKVVVDTELTNFAGSVEEILTRKGSSSPDGQKAAEDLLILAQQCIGMTSTEFRTKCERIVHDLAEKRQQCQGGLLKQLFTHMLFILTRCTRLLQFENMEPINEDSLFKFRQCLESIPTVEMNWGPPKDNAKQGLSTAYSLPCKPDQVNRKVKTPSNDSVFSTEKPLSRSSQVESRLGETCITEFHSQTGSATTTRHFSSYREDIVQYHQVDGGLPKKLLKKSSGDSLNGKDRIIDGSDSVICRICEEIVPTTHLESHSYICAYAEKCNLNSLDVNERLAKLTEILDQIVESCTLGFNVSYESPDTSKLRTANSMTGSEVQSPRITEWHHKGVEGMFEDIHEMDTACIDDSHHGGLSNLKSHLAVKLSQCGATSSTGSQTSASSTNTPRTSHFELFWLEYNNTSEPEDLHQMSELVDIANCIASTDLMKEGSPDYLVECMRDLQDILLECKVRALVIDTFGSRIENLLREKYALACEVMDDRSPTDVSKFNGSGCLGDSTSQSSTMSTPSHGTHKERTSIDDFEMIKPISRGAYGKVFLARKRTTGDLFAIKVLKKLDMIRKNDIERILAERNILITVRNPFVVRFFYSFTCRDNLYLVMEYLNGGDLYSLLRKVGCLEEDIARTYIAELVLALEYLHSMGIVHRDLKPDNILIAHDGHTKLTDFGLSKIGLINSTVDLSGSETDETSPIDTEDLHTSFEHTAQTEEITKRSAVGTPDYLAPEILLGTQHGYAADWWSVGVILFELITGTPPFNAECPQSIFANILNQKIPWPAVPTDMSFEARDLIESFLIHDPDQRLGANGASEVKAHSFFKGINWDTLALQKAAFLPSPDSADDTSYFTSRYSEISHGVPEDQHCSDTGSDSTGSCSDCEHEIGDCGELNDFESPPLDLSMMNFSFKNLSQLASINYDLLIQSGRTPSKGSSPTRDGEF